MADVPAERWAERYVTRYRFMRVSRDTGYEVAQLANIRADGSKVERNLDTQTKESATLAAVGAFDLGRDLIRCYFCPEWADGYTADIAIGTWLPNAPKREVDGEAQTVSVECSSRLQELADDMFDGPITVEAGTDPVEAAASFVRECGLDVEADESGYTLSSAWTFGISNRSGSESSSSDQGSSKLDAVNDLLDVAGFASASVDGMGTVQLRRYRAPSEKTPVWSFAEGPAARFERAMTDERDTSAVANVVRVVYTTEEAEYIGIAVDDSPTSEWSTVTRGRRIVASYEYNDLPDGTDETTIQAYADAKAMTLLTTEQAPTRIATFAHVYAPIGLSDVVTLSFPTGGVSGDFSVRTMSLDLSGGGLRTQTEARMYETRG